MLMTHLLSAVFQGVVSAGFTIVLRDIRFDEYLKPAWTDIIFLVVTININLRYLYTN
jgi:hypothetical protein